MILGLQYTERKGKSMKYSRNKNINDIVTSLISNGWSPIKKSRHWQIASPLGERLTIPSTPSDNRALLNFRGDVKRLQE